MTRSHLTLAALATSALPGLKVTNAAALPSSSTNYRSALLTLGDGHHILVQAPRNQTAEARQSAEIVSLNALTEGVRARLPFEVQTVLGQAPYGPTRAVVLNYIYGRPVQTSSITAGSALAENIGKTLAAIHALPASVVSQAGLVHYTAADCRQQTLTLLDRALDTGKVPVIIEERWRKASTDIALWQFQPTVIHASIHPENLLAIGDDITGVLGWENLKVADPALDLGWVMSGLDPEAAETVLDSYGDARGINIDESLRKRTALYAELELARWLIHGVDSKDESIIEDAISMLHSLLDRVKFDINNPLADTEHQPMSEHEVSAYLSNTQVDAAEQSVSISYDEASFDEEFSTDTEDSDR